MVKVFHLFDYYLYMIYKCKYCGKEFESSQKIAGHTLHCKKSPKYEQSIEQLKKARSGIRRDENGQIFIHKGEICECQFCHKQFKLHGLKNHERYCDLNPNKSVYYRCYRKDRIYYVPGGWNKGLTKETDERVKKMSETVKKHYKEGLYQIWCTGKTKENNETVRKIAESNSEYMKKKHKKGEAFYWGKYGKISYPEQYFMNIFNKEFPPYEYNYHELTYYLDFAWVQSKKYIEIDGEQHKKQIEHDIERDNKLKELGWSCIRVDWSKFIKLDESERQNFINDLKQFIIN